MSVNNFDMVINIRALFPKAQVELDNDGQIIIYTGCYDNGEEGSCLWREPRARRSAGMGEE